MYRPAYSLPINYEGMPPWSTSELNGLLPRICVSVTGATPAEMLATATHLLPEFPFQELRLDYLETPASAMPVLREFLGQHTEVRFLATCRRQAAGGRFQGSAADELSLLCAAAAAGFLIVDLSLESAEELGPAAIARLRRAGAAVLVSYHDFNGTGDLEAIFARLRPLGPDLYKVVTTAKDLRDSLTVLRFLKEAANADRTPAIVLAMGEPGIPTRILGPRAGSAFTFAAATESEATAPGQLTARTLSDLYRVDKLTPDTRIFGVAGDPIHSSLSPLMLNTAFHEAGLDAVFLPLKTSSAEELFEAARELPLRGMGVTMPLKQAVLPYLDHIDPLAARIGAVNTVHCTEDGQFHGYNTDAAGIIRPLERRLSLRDARVLVLGAGGAARAAVFACADQGARVSIYNRTQDTAQSLANEAGARVIGRQDLTTEDFDVLIHATPAGMRNHPLTLPLAEAELRAGLVFDLVYNPTETSLLAMAKARGLATIAGAEMFVDQGTRQFEIWTGRAAPVEAMQAAVLHALALKAR